jgi:hypothetical protein
MILIPSRTQHDKPMEYDPRALLSHYVGLDGLAHKTYDAVGRRIFSCIFPFPSKNSVFYEYKLANGLRK